MSLGFLSHSISSVASAHGSHTSFPQYISPAISRSCTDAIAPFQPFFFFFIRASIQDGAVTIKVRGNRVTKGVLGRQRGVCSGIKKHGYQATACFELREPLSVVLTNGHARKSSACSASFLSFNFSRSHAHRTSISRFAPRKSSWFFFLFNW